MLAFAKNTLQEMAVCGIVFVVGFAFVAFFVGLIVYKLRQNTKNRAAWQEFSKKFDLHMKNPRQLEMKGIYNSCEVKLAIGVRRTGSGEDRSVEYYTYCLTDFPHSLRFLLNISSPKGWLSNLFNSNQMLLGQTNFDKRFNVKCYDPQILQRLLLSDFPSAQTQNLMGDLMLASNSFGIINVTDTQVYVETGGTVSDVGRLKQMLDVTSNLAGRFKTARESFPLTDWEKQTLLAWQNLAETNNLTLDAKNFTLRGSYKNFPVKVALETAKEKWQTEIELRFPANLAAGLKIMPENSIHKVMSWLGMQDIEAGIKEFDDTFIVKAKNVAHAKHLLKPDLCRQLVGLKTQVSDFLVTDEQISVSIDSVLGDRQILKSYLEAVSLTARMIFR